jgi:hypothetical protein
MAISIDFSFPEGDKENIMKRISIITGPIEGKERLKLYFD